MMNRDLRVNYLVASVTTIIAIIIFFYPTSQSPDFKVLRGVALGLFIIGIYATQIVPELVASLALFFIAIIFSVSPTSIIFSGFQSTAFWLVFGGLIVGIAVEKTGLGIRLADTILSRLGSTYATIVAGTICVGVVLSFLLPSTMGRIMLLLPIILALCDRLGYNKGRKGRTGLIMAMAAGTWMPSSSILPANVPNMVLTGVADNFFDIQLNYGSYFLLHFPMIGIAKSILIFATVMLIFRDNPPDMVIQPSKVLPWNRDEKFLAVGLFLTLSLWSTDFLHGISPAWIALGAGLYCLMPIISLVDKNDFNAKLNTGSLIYVAAILGLGNILIDTGAGDMVGTQLLSIFPLEFGNSFQNYISIVGFGIILNMAATAPSVPALLAPLASDLSSASGLPLITVLMTMVIGYSTVIFPYQVPPIIIAMQLGNISLRDATITTAIISLVTIAVLIPLNYFWWVILGYIS